MALKKRLSMRTIKRLLELRFQEELSQRQIAKALGCGRRTIQRYEALALEKQLTDFNVIKDLSEEEILQRLGLRSSPFPLSHRKPPEYLPDYIRMHSELSRKHVTLALLWEEYIAAYPDGYQYSQYCELYRQWQKTLRVSMRQEHKAGEKTFIDYAGTTFPIVVNRRTMEVREAQLFVATLGASSYTYCEFTWTQRLHDWLMSHRRMFEYFGGASQIQIPDNLKGGVNKPDRYESTPNRSYEELCRHYGTCVIPARRRKPKDKAKVEVGVLLASRWILAALRNEVFYSLEGANEAAWRHLKKLNNKSMRQLKKSRFELFEAIDKPALLPLPATPYVLSEWKQARVNIDHHIAFDGCFYSVPYELVQKQVDIRATDSTVEIFSQNQRVASHKRSYQPGHFTTQFDHRPVGHQEQLKWTPERIINWAAQKGPEVALFIERLIAAKDHPEQGYRAAVGVIRLASKYGTDRLGKACKKALSVDSPSYRTVKNMLQNKMENMEPAYKDDKPKPFLNSNRNVRGSEYYANPKP